MRRRTLTGRHAAVATAALPVRASPYPQVLNADDGWTPPLEAIQLWDVLDKLSRWTPLDLEQVFDDLNRVQWLVDGDRDLPEVVERLRSTLANLVNICRSSDRWQVAPELLLVADRAGQELEGGAELPPAAPRHRRGPWARRNATSSLVGDARRTAWLTGELLELASAARLVKDEDAP